MISRGSILLVLSLMCLFLLFVFAKVDGGFLSWFLLYFFAACFLYELATRWFTLRNVSVSRRVSVHHLSASESLDVQILLNRNHIWPMFWVKITDELSEKLFIRANGCVQTFMPLWQKERYCTYQITGLPRGIHYFNTIRIERGDLLGIQKFSTTYTEFHRIVVYPRVVPVRGWSTAYAKESGGTQAIQRRAEESTNVIGIRQYVQGDKLNRIHWPASARTGSLQSKEFELQVASDFMFIADASLQSFSMNQSEILFELEMVITASLMKYTLDSKRRFGAAIHANRFIRFDPARGSSLFTRCMEALAELQPVCPTSFAASLARMANDLPSGCTFVIISPSLCKDTAAAAARIRKHVSVEWFVPVQHASLPVEMLDLARMLRMNRIYIHFISKPEQLLELSRGGSAFAK